MDPQLASPARLEAEKANVQARTFSRWINGHLRRRFGKESAVNDLFTDLRDGQLLLDLIEALTGKRLAREKGRLRVHQTSNLTRVLDHLRDTEGIRLVNIDANDLANGNAKLTLGLIWSMILHFHIDASTFNPMSPTGKAKGGADTKTALLLWCQQRTKGYDRVQVDNFSKSWRDGRAFCALVHSYRPDLIEFSSLATTTHPGRADSAVQDLRHIFNVAEKQLGVEPLLEAEDINVPVPDDRSIMMYVATMQQALYDQDSRPSSPQSPLPLEQLKTPQKTVRQEEPKSPVKDQQAAEILRLQKQLQEAEARHSKETNKLSNNIVCLIADKKALQQQLEASKAKTSEASARHAELAAKHNALQQALVEVQESMKSTSIVNSPRQPPLAPKFDELLGQLHALRDRLRPNK